MQNHLFIKCYEWVKNCVHYPSKNKYFKENITDCTTVKLQYTKEAIMLVQIAHVFLFSRRTDGRSGLKLSRTGKEIIPIIPSQVAAIHKGRFHVPKTSENSHTFGAQQLFEKISLEQL